MLSMWKLSLLSYDAGAQDLFWPLVSRGVGLGFALFRTVIVSAAGAGVALVTAVPSAGGNPGRAGG